MEIKLVKAYHMHDDVVELFSEYTDMLRENDREMAMYLDVQNYNEEIKNLEVKYGMPEGRLYAALVDDQVAGCIALRKINEENAEVKRLFVKPEFRGYKLGEKLVKQLIEDAREIGYKHILLDTLPFLKSAIKLYQNLGFYEIDSYNGAPLGHLIYMKYDL